MKKFLIPALTFAVALVGCSKGDVIDAPGRGQEVEFNTYFGTVPTKAESASLEYMQTKFAEESPAFHVYGYIHREIVPGTDGKIDISSISTAQAYMNKDVWWSENADQAGIPEEVTGLKVIFSTTATTLEGSYNGTDIPEGWVDNYVQDAVAYATSSLNVDVWSAWNVVALTDENRTNVGGAWEYAGVTYWPDASSGRKLAFSAYSLNAKDCIKFAEDENGNTSLTEFVYEVPAAVSAQQDLLVTPFIPNQGITAQGGQTTVGLVFRHLLSRIGFSLIANRTDDDINIDIKSVTLNGTFPKKGNVNLKDLDPKIVPIDGDNELSYELFSADDEICRYTSSMTAQPIYANYKTTTDGGVEATGNSADNRYMMIMPCTQSTGAYIEVVYQLTEADEQTAKISLENWVFRPGTSYDFVLKVSTSAIGFYVEVTPWDNYFSSTGTTGNGIFTLTPEIPGVE